MSVIPFFLLLYQFNNEYKMIILKKRNGANLSGFWRQWIIFVIYEFLKKWLFMYHSLCVVKYNKKVFLIFAFK